MIRMPAFSVGVRKLQKSLKTDLCSMLWIDTIPVGIRLFCYLKGIYNNGKIYVIGKKVIICQVIVNWVVDWMQFSDLI